MGAGLGPASAWRAEETDRGRHRRDRIMPFDTLLEAAGRGWIPKRRSHLPGPGSCAVSRRTAYGSVHGLLAKRLGYRCGPGPPICWVLDYLTEPGVMYYETFVHTELPDPYRIGRRAFGGQSLGPSGRADGLGGGRLACNHARLRNPASDAGSAFLGPALSRPSIGCKWQQRCCRGPVPAWRSTGRGAWWNGQESGIGLLRGVWICGCRRTGPGIAAVRRHSSDGSGERRTG